MKQGQVVSRNVNLAYRGHQIIAAVIKGAPLAQVYVGKTLVTRERFAGDTLDESVNRARSWVDAQRSEAIQNRRSAGVGTVEEYVAFFSTHTLAEHHRKMLIAHASAPDRTLTAGELASAAGWADFGAANLHFGILGDQVAHALELTLPTHSNGRPIATAALADSVDPDWKPIEGYFRWRLHDEVAEALQRLNVR